MLSRRFFSSEKLARAQILAEWKTALKFTAPINKKFMKCLRTSFSSDAEAKHCHICFLQRPGYKL